MGLDTSHNAWHGAYGAFSRWRNKIAEAAGYEIAKVEGQYGLRETILIDWGHIAEENYYGEWDEVPSDPLILLIAHSDCEGVIHPEHARLLADRLEGLIPLLPDEDVLGHIGNYRSKTRQFVDGLRAAVAANEDVDFH
jgi:hypothetical protein